MLEDFLSSSCVVLVPYILILHIDTMLMILSVLESIFISMFYFWLFQAAQQERTTFISSLLPLLTEYSLQPPVPDAQSIVSNVKVSLLMRSNCIDGFSLVRSVLLQNPYQLAVKLGCSL